MKCVIVFVDGLRRHELGLGCQGRILKLPVDKDVPYISIFSVLGLRMSLTLTAMSDSAMTSRHQQWSGVGQTQPPPRGPYISVITNRTTNLVIRGAMLFSVGVFLALVLNLLQVQRNVTLFPPDVISSIFSSAWWVPPCCGMASAMIGLLYPCIDRHLGEPHKFKREWSSVMRCVAVFVGINHASAKVDFANNIQLSLTLAALSIGLWWTFDRSRSGFGLGISIALLATLATQLLVYNGVFQGDNDGEHRTAASLV
ncbi:insulin-induced gene 2 protein isoform X2 [Hippoglossus hippoglossus]|uniref:insulin-induced gene 2 protein isoform X2 n=1 Tax=Hippoglossus hippoglossus TaxID=8267 RepID=UPI00148D4D85|nr:insulin-induced gene 2 protein isoform X2 [Hippoglossus hippoglossus]XP_035030071.1 insulin-induced gene 2 protein isoform X4 [Hippoglossus stenolepis]